MTDRHISIDFIEYSSFDEMEPLDKELVEKSIDALRGSYSPYSRFKVGAALRLEDGEAEVQVGVLELPHHCHAVALFFSDLRLILSFSEQIGCEGDGKCHFSCTLRSANHDGMWHPLLVSELLQSFCDLLLSYDFTEFHLSLSCSFVCKFTKKKCFSFLI